MATIRRFTTAIGVVAATVAGVLVGEGTQVAAARTPTRGDGAATMVAIDDLVRRWLDDNDLPGANVAVTKGSRLVWSKGYGYADVEHGVAMQPFHRVRVGSTSKMITTIAALKLVEQGRVDLDEQVYGDIAALWGSTPGAEPGTVVGGDGALDDASAYAEALVDGVNASHPMFPPAEHADEFPSEEYGVLIEALYEDAIETALERASGVRVRHVLSHTAGFNKSDGNAKSRAETMFGLPLDDVSTAQYHQAILAGPKGNFQADPSTEEHYSNIGFVVAGAVVEEASTEGSYRQYATNHVFGPLGLDDAVPNNVGYGPLDAVPYEAGAALAVDPTVVSRLALAAGGWSLSARDLARVMCATDQQSNNERLLQPASVAQMAADAEPGAPGVNPLGWDSADATAMTKNGFIPGGSSRMSKFLPGEFASTSDEINVAIAVNQSDSVPPTSLLEDVAEIAAGAAAPAGYDLFDPEHRCRKELGLADGSRRPDPKPAKPTNPNVAAAAPTDRRVHG